MIISPPVTEFSANPGDVLSGVVKLISDEAVPKTFYASCQPFTSRGETGEPAFLEEEIEEFTLASWIELEETVVVLDQMERKEIAYTIKVPKNADPGGHFAVIFWSTQPPVLKGTGVAIAGKIGTLVLLRIAGEIEEKGQLLEFDTIDSRGFFTRLPVDFYLRFENQGNVHLKPQGEIKIEGLFNVTSTPATLLVNMAGGNVLPDSIRRYENSWTKSGLVFSPQGFFEELKAQWKGFSLGKFTARLNLFYGVEGKQVRAEKSFWVFPWLLILTIAIGVIAVIFGLKVGIKKYNAWIVRKAKP